MWSVSRRVNKTGTGDDDPTLLDEVAGVIVDAALRRCPGTPRNDVPGLCFDLGDMPQHQACLPVRSANATPRASVPTRRTVVERPAPAKGASMAAPTAAAKDLNDRASLGLSKWSDWHCLCGRYEG